MEKNREGLLREAGWALYKAMNYRRLAAVKGSSQEILTLIGETTDRWESMRQSLTPEEVQEAVAFAKERLRRDASALEEALEELKEERRPL